MQQVALFEKPHGGDEYMLGEDGCFNACNRAYNYYFYTAHFHNLNYTTMRQPTNFEKKAGILFTDDEKDRIWLATQGTLRKLVGIMGLLLPVALWLGLFIDTGHTQPVESISHYYYTRVAGVFIIIVSLLAFFLIIYKGEEPAEFYISLMAGLFALIMLIFPTNNLMEHCNKKHDIVVTILKKSEFRTNLHLIAAGLFLGCLAVMSIWLFTKPAQPKNQAEVIILSRKSTRNGWYIGCGVVMFIMLAAILISMLTNFDESDFYKNNSLTFWFESFAVWSFGISWMIKGHTFSFLNDKKQRAGLRQ